MQHFDPDPWLQLLKKHLMREVMPAVTSALIKIAAERPRDPVGALSKALCAKADKQDALHFDPYDAAIYQERRDLVAAKEARVAVRAQETLDKVERCVFQHGLASPVISEAQEC